MLIDHLSIHPPSKRGQGSTIELRPFGAYFTLDTCQRRLWVGDARGGGFPAAALSGEEAYLLLLRIATGLESAVAGETDVFGQLKQAWREFAESGNALVAEL